MAKKILAVSGGVDSMVMLDMLIDNDVVVAHFDHGTRTSSKTDVDFVKKVAESSGIKFASERAELGDGASEELARTFRYGFLRKISEENDSAQIYTAHHLDDLVETVAINLLRGTGWRGLTPLDTPDIRRPFLEPEFFGLSEPWSKNDVMIYAAEHEVAFRQDPTNAEDNYLRNRLREKLKVFDKKQAIYELWQKQKKLKTEIDEIVAKLLPEKGKAWQRSWFKNLDKNVALEILRAGTLRAGISATRPQLENFRQAILTYAPGKSFNLPGDKLVRFSKDEFYLE